jgi:hypothetical protein
MAIGHLCEKCDTIPSEIREELLFLRDQKTKTTAGRKYWSDAASALEVNAIEGRGLAFHPNLR